MYKETLYISHESQERVFSVEQCMFDLLCDHDPVVRKCFFLPSCSLSAPSVFLLCVDFVSALLSSGTRARFRGMRAEVEQQLACFVTASGPQSLTAD